VTSEALSRQRAWRSGVVGTSITFAVIAVLVKVSWAPLARLDRSVLHSLGRYAAAHHGFVTAMKVVSDAGSSAFYLPAFAGIVAYFLWRRRGWSAAYVVLAVLGSQLLNAALKAGFHRPRPHLALAVAHARGWSFPSGHAQGATVAYGTLLVLLWPSLSARWRVVVGTSSAAIVLALGFSRLALGVHYTSDVAAGFAVGAAWVLLGAGLLRSRSGG
jgi:undecaprenyl-diphosphatase